ncbi:hypothetical protein BGP77_11450 [Saccharospirillum sp. MSK14-1]|uniref:hypothetical protein n=1 Tax=Saccharospirillum sp. MSK14-1 TaxID=1897632 RepID=UPI000D348AB9|nr:hypothetical protein [Saccharospirillum sp. MSK14-1]PTY38556.1 hypothetical protein BGP77_11450 [Saccharospirillum sp. MSK14-1]
MAANNKPKTDTAETTPVLALVDNASYKLKCGFVYALPTDIAQSLKKQGIVDDNEKAIAGGKKVSEPNTDSKSEQDTD